ncbi:MAG: type II secretion system protein [Patescibacteria group bacterium]
MKHTLRSGFTLIELMVTMGIVTVIMSIVLFSYSRFNDRLALTTAAQELAITIRQAQSYGLNVKESGVGNGQFTSAYGIYFNPPHAASAYAGDPTHYVLFVDNQTVNKTYNSGSGTCGSSSTECVEIVTLRNGVTISAVCDGAGECPPTRGSGGTRALSITFLRPNPDADINFINAGGNILLGGEPTGKVVLKSPQGNTIMVVVEKTGQISIQ